MELPGRDWVDEGADHCRHRQHIWSLVNGTVLTARISFIFVKRIWPRSGFKGFSSFSLRF